MTRKETETSALIDAAGRMPLEQARAVLAGKTVAFNHREVVSQKPYWLTQADVVWAALLSLSDAEEACEAAAKVVWKGTGPRGWDNTSLFDRYGEGIIPFLRTRIDADGIMQNDPTCVLSCAVLCGGSAGFELIWEARKTVLGSQHQCTHKGSIMTVWAAFHPELAVACLKEKVAEGDSEAKRYLAAIRGAPKDPESLLSAAADWLLHDNLALWPQPLPGCVTKPARITALRGRRGAWALVIERPQGRKNVTQMARFIYGNRLKKAAQLNVRAGTAWADEEGLREVAGLSDANVVFQQGKVKLEGGAPMETPAIREAVEALKAR